jgi:hypothetical protein
MEMAYQALQRGSGFLRERFLNVSNSRGNIASISGEGMRLPMRFFLLYLLTLALSAFGGGHFYDGGIILLAALLSVTPRLLFRWCKQTIPFLFECACALLVLSTLILGEMVGLYDSVEWWDLPPHALAGGLVAYGTYLVLNNLLPRLLPPLRRHILIVVLSILVALGVGGVWETYEYTVDHFIQANMQPSRQDTTEDLIAGLIGALVASGFMRRK